MAELAFGDQREGVKALDRDLRADPLNVCDRALGIASGLVADGGQLGNPRLERRIAHIDQSILDRFIEPGKLGLDLSRAPFHLGDVLAALGHPFVASGNKLVHQHFKARGIEQPLLQVLDHRLVQPIHRKRDAGASRLPFRRLGRAGVVAILLPTPAGAGAQRHRATATGAEADARQERRSAHRPRRHHLRAARFQGSLHGLELRHRYDRRHLHDGVLGLRLRAPLLHVIGVEAVLADIGGPRQHLMDHALAPPTAIARADIILIEPARDRHDPDRPAPIRAFQRQPENAAHRFGVERIDLQLFLDLRAALLGRDRAIADRRTGAIPETLPGVFVHRAQRMLAVLLRLIFVEQRHDFPHHLAHRIIAENLRDGDELHAVLRQLAEVELELELIAEKAREAMDHDHVEGRRPFQRRVDHFLEGGTAIVCARNPRLDKLGRDFPAVRVAIARRLAALVRDRQIALGRTRRRDAQVERGPQRRLHGSGFRGGESSVRHRSTNL